MEQFDAVNPLVYRYLPRDNRLKNFVDSISKKDIISNNYLFEKIDSLIDEFLLPRIKTLGDTLEDLAIENSSKKIPSRIDGQHKGDISLSRMLNLYRTRLEYVADCLENIADLDNEILLRNDQVVDLTYYAIKALTVEANIANDIRHHFRSEINEVKHKNYPASRIGSSTMPHKINPVEFENIVSLWKAYYPRIVSSLLFSIQEHQGDSTNMLLPLHSFEILVATSYTSKSLNDYLTNISFNI